LACHRDASVGGAPGGGLASLEFGMAIVQYFACALVSIEVKAGQVVDMRVWYEKQRVAFPAFIVLSAVPD